MKMKVSGLEGIELSGEIARLCVTDGSLVMEMRLNKPVGWKASAALTHKDLMVMAKLLLLRPVNLRYLLFGFGKPGRPKSSAIGD